jgi:uracil-DNA glycosylase
MPDLVREMDSIKPQTIVLMGTVAWKTPRVAGIRYVETYHPAAAMRFPKIRGKFENDFPKLKAGLPTSPLTKCDR